MGGHQDRITDYTALVLTVGKVKDMTYQKITGTLSQGAHPGSYNGQGAYNDMLLTVPRKGESMDDYIVRRLTPTECARLQGFPDWWCEDVPHKDSAEYKMWGNGMALPCALYVMEGIAAAMDEAERKEE